MCTKIVDYKSIDLDHAALFLDPLFEHVNVFQFTFVYNHHQHYSFLDILQHLPLVFYVIQSISGDERIVKVTVVTKQSSFTLHKIVKDVLKDINLGKFKVFIHF